MTPDHTLEAFKSRRDLWMGCFGGSDRHSIINQICGMVWKTAAFRVVIECRRIAPPARGGGVELNGMVHDLIDRGFFEGQLLAVRRLTDTYPIMGDRRGRDVWSLTSLIDDMKESRSLMTRANFFAAEGLEYDVERVEQQLGEYYAEKRSKGERSFCVPMELDSDRPRERHKQIDFLAGVAKECRSPEDVVRDAIFEHLKEMVDTACSGVRVVVDKFIAHAASPESRRTVSADDASVTFGHLHKAHEVICKAATFLDLYLLSGSSRHLLAFPTYNQFAYIDRPLVTAEGLTTLKTVWDEYGDETRKWAEWGIEGFRREFPQERMGDATGSDEV
jgi:hypothetical protein